MSVAVHTANDATVLFDPANLDRSDSLLRETPFRFLIARDQLPPEAARELEHDFPKYPSAGFFPYEEKDCGPSVNRLIGALTDPDVASAVGAKLGIERLGQYPTLVTLCRALNKR